MGGVAAASECAIKQQLIEHVRAAMDDIVGLTRREVEAAIAGDQDVITTIRQRLEKARQHKDALLAEYQAHINGHHC